MTAYTCLTPTVTPTPTATNTPTNTPTNTVTNTPTPSCVDFLDTYGSTNSLNNYNYYDKNWNATTASPDYWSVSGGVFLNAPVGIGGLTVGSYVPMTPTAFPTNLSNYTEEGDFNLGTGGQGLFGLLFLSNPTAGTGYVFQLNGTTWQIEKQTGPVGGTAGYSYVETSGAGPAYTLGTWIHLKVVISPSGFSCYAGTESSPGTYISLTTIFNLSLIHI